MDENKKNKSLFVGIGLILIGSIVLLERLNYHSDFIMNWLYRWESVMILVGILLIIVRRKYFGGIISILIGGYFLIDDLYFLPENSEIWFLPAILIFGGLGYILQPSSKECIK
ncbi:hypothetical protein GCQ56_06805 [Marinifilum sp. N1E240]|uniref:LiaF transmembrane domain-containing protein n=1 Tax=Marinifilum sp. N1E240 TaxID=2608082 RepID=UPI00128CED01|nr:hypothetical protein [Marinifilum sp. N1E240]MPQ46718.1 hypothetical protein [Marinifilum sp. N1E240]